MAQQIFFRRPKFNRKKQEQSDSNFNVGRRLGSARSNSRAASSINQDIDDVIAADEAARQESVQYLSDADDSFDPRDQRDYIPNAIARLEKNKRVADRQREAADKLARREAAPGYEPSSTQGDLGHREAKQIAKDLHDRFQNAKSSHLSNDAAKGRNWWQRNKQKSGIGLGVGGGILTVFALISLLLPFKIPSLTQAITDFASKRVGNVVEKRVERMLLRYMLNGSQAAEKGGRVIATGNLLGDLYKNIRVSSFEKNLLNNHGIEIKPGSGGGIRISVSGRDSDNLSDLDAIKNYLDRDLNGREANKALKKVVALDVAGWRWHKRAKFVKWFRLKYGFSRFGILNRDNQDRSERAKEMQKDRLEKSTTRAITNLLDAFDCLMGQNCKVEDLGGEKPDKEAAKGKSDVESAVRESTQEAVDKQVADAGQPNKIGQKVRERVVETITKTFVGKLATKAIPIIGWIDILATLDHIGWNIEENNYMSKIAPHFKKLSYALVYAEWAGYGDQIKAGEMDDAFMEVLAASTEGVEGAAAFSYVNRQKPVGQFIPEGNKVNENKLFWADAQQDRLNNIPLFGDYTRAMRVGVHHVLNAYYETLGEGGILGFLSDLLSKIPTELLVGPVVNLINEFTDWEDLAKQLMADAAEHLLTWLGWVADPLATGAELYNNIHAGATVSYDDYCKESLGCRKLTADEATQQSRAIERDADALFASLPLKERLFSLDNSSSFASLFTQKLPLSRMNSLENVASATLSLVGALPSSLANLASKPVGAQSFYDDFEWVDMYGTDPYGALEDELQEPVESQLEEKETLDEVECPESDGKKLNICAADKEVYTSLECAIVTDIEEDQEEEGVDVATKRDECLHDIPDGGGGEEGSFSGACEEDESLVGKKVDYTGLYPDLDAGNVPEDKLGAPYKDQERFRLLCGPPYASFVALSKAYQKQFDVPIPVLDDGGYRSEEQQRECARVNPACINYNPNEEPPEHMWGTGIDFNEPLNETNNEYHIWLEEHGPEYGWFWPPWASGGGGGSGGNVTEPWHFQYYFKGHSGEDAHPGL